MIAHLTGELSHLLSASRVHPCSLSFPNFPNSLDCTDDANERFCSIMLIRVLFLMYVQYQVQNFPNDVH